VKDERAKTIEAGYVERLEKNLDDQRKILKDERLKRLGAMLDGVKVNADLHDERTNKKLVSKGQELNAGSDRSPEGARSQASALQR